MTSVTPEVPVIGVLVEVKSDARGLSTTTRFLDNPLADRVLDVINAEWPDPSHRRTP